MFQKIKSLYRKAVLNRTKVHVARSLFFYCEEEYKKGAMSLQTAAQVCNTTPEAFLFAIGSKKRQELESNNTTIEQRIWVRNLD